MIGLNSKVEIKAELRSFCPSEDMQDFDTAEISRPLSKLLKASLKRL
jgi:hypothetical protein